MWNNEILELCAGRFLVKKKYPVPKNYKGKITKENSLCPREARKKFENFQKSIEKNKQKNENMYFGGISE